MNFVKYLQAGLNGVISTIVRPVLFHSKTDLASHGLCLSLGCGVNRIIPGLKDLFKSADLGDFSLIEPLDLTPEQSHGGDGKITDYCGKLVQAPYLGAFADPEFCMPKT